MFSLSVFRLLPDFGQQVCSFDRWVWFCNQEVGRGRRQGWPTIDPGDDGDGDGGNGGDGGDYGDGGDDGDTDRRLTYQQCWK